MVACALLVLGAFAPVASARRVERKSATAVLPAVDLLGRLRDRERIVSLSTSTAADARIEVFLQVFCFDRQLRVHRRQRTLTGTGQLRARLHKPARLQGLLGERLGEGDEPTAAPLGGAARAYSAWGGAVRAALMLARGGG
jgi:predicted phage tail protein